MFINSLKMIKINRNLSELWQMVKCPYRRRFNFYFFYDAAAPSGLGLPC